MSLNIHSRIHDFTTKNLKKIFADRLIPEKHRIIKRLTRSMFVFDDTNQIECDDLCHVQGCPVSLLNP